MGVSNSVPLWLNPNQTPADYDEYGYLASMSNPPQYDWDELRTEGIPPLNTFTPAYLQGKAKTVTQNTLHPTTLVGQLNERLAVWGQPQFARRNDTHLNGVDMYTAPFAEPNPTSEFKNPPWTWSPSATTCTPLTFPHCDMTDFATRVNVSQWAPWWGGTLNFPSGGIQYSAATPSVNPVDWYTAAVDKATDSYAGGKYANLIEVNTADTSAYDPCAGDSFLEQILPPLLGSVALIVEDVYLAEFVSVVPENAKLALQLGTFFTVNYIAKAWVDQAKIDEDEGPQLVQDDIEKAANALSLSAGWIAGSVAAPQLDASGQYLIPIQIGGTILGRIMLPVTTSLVKSVVTSGGLGTKLPLIVFRFINKLFCRISNAGQNACDDFGDAAGGTKNGFPEARRWDVPSLAARLTDIAAEENGWARDSQEARFVFRSLVTNPKWLEAGTVTGETSLYNGPQGINPLGLIAPIEETGYTNVSQNYSDWDWKQVWSDTRYGWTGEKSKGEKVKEQNLYACQNFDLLFNAADCGPGENTPSCATNRPDNGEDVQISNYMRNWLQAAVDKTGNPVNFIKQFQIPGLSSSTTQVPDELPPVEVFLKNANKDETDATGVGFNTVTARGEFASLYLGVGNFPLAEGVDETEVIANSLFTLSSLTDAWAWATKNWDKRNQIALAHMWYKDDQLTWGFMQRDSFNLWENGDRTAHKFYVKHAVNLGFEPAKPIFNPISPPDPPIVSKPIGLKGRLEPVLPYIVSKPIGLTPALTPVTPIGDPDDWVQVAALKVGQNQWEDAAEYLIMKGFEVTGNAPPAGSPWLNASAPSVALAYIIVQQGIYGAYQDQVDVLRAYGFPETAISFTVQQVSCALLGSNSAYPIQSYMNLYTPAEKAEVQSLC